jgi:molybdopterin synthase catalytic subunit
MNTVRVLFFASLRDRAGKRETSIQIPQGVRVIQLKDRLKVEFPGLAEAIDTSLVSVNREFAFDDDVIPEHAEVAIFPPVSGGSVSSIFPGRPTELYITEDQLDLDELISRITLPNTGALCIFTGTVRAMTSRGEAHETEYLEYESYVPMAEAKMHQVAEEIRQRWPEVEGIAIVQRIGRLYPGTPTVLIACSAAHRDMGVFEATRYGIDRLKEIVPIWKKETGPGGEVWVEGEYIPRRGE